MKPLAPVTTTFISCPGCLRLQMPERLGEPFFQARG